MKTMIDKAKVLGEIERLKIEKRKEKLPFHALYYDGYEAACDKIIAYLNSIPVEKQPSVDLENAATALTNEIVGELNAGDYTDHSGHNAHWHSFKEGVVAGAQWQKEQTINKACEWLNKNVVEYHPRTGKLRPVVNINAFREAMENQNEE